MIRYLDQEFRAHVNEGKGMSRYACEKFARERESM